MGPERHLRRRQLLLGAAAAALGGLARSPPSGAGPARHAVYLVPGYRASMASHRGIPADQSPSLRRSFPTGYEGGVTLVSRVDERDGSTRRALMPVVGHKITVAPDGATAVWSSMNGPNAVTFDPSTLELGVMVGTCGADFVGGGHAVFAPDGAALLSSERRRPDGLPARADAHHGRLVIRDPRTLRVLETYDAQGIAPHEIALTSDGRHVAIANYGSPQRTAGEAPTGPFEPSLTVLELASGRLVYKRPGPVADAEVRHLAICGQDRIAAICARQRDADAVRDSLAPLSASTDEQDLSVDEGVAYLPAPIAWFDPLRAERPAAATMPADAGLARQGQSILYDPRHDEVLVTFASSHAVIAFAAVGGAVRRVIRTDRLGLRYPRGIALHPDGEHYVVSGSWQGIYQFRRGTHAVSWERNLHPVLFDHSHLTLMPA